MSEKLTNLPDGVAAAALFYTVSDGVSSKVTGGAANGVATLDAGGKVPSNMLPALGVSYQGLWNASTNTPTLANGVGTAGDFYFVSVAGSQNLGSGVIAFDLNDRVIYEGGVWENAPAHAGVQTVNAKPGPDVVLAAADVSAVAVRPPSEHSFAYGRNNAGLEQPVPWSQGADGFTLAMRDIGGQITTATPVDPTDAATKGYVDTSIAAVDVAPAWGAITGTLANQADLDAALTAKADASALATHVANVAVGAHVPTGGTSGQVLTRGAGAAAAWAALTKAQVGLGNADDTSDANKPISTATQTALNAKAAAADLTTHIGQTGAATHLPPGGTAGQIPIKGAGTAVAWGDAPSGGGGVTSVNGKTGVVLLGPDDVGSVSQAVAPNQVYTTDGTAQQSSLDFNPAGDVTNGGVAVYTGTGTLKAGTPAVVGDVATKGYVDTADALAVAKSGAANVVYATAGAGVQTTIPHATGATVSSVVVRDAAGRTQVVDPAAAADVATKNYVDTHPGLAGGVTSVQGKTGVVVLQPADIGAEQTPVAGSIALRDAAGHIQAVDPAVAADVATKSYVDTTVASGTGAVASVNTKTGVVVLNAADVGAVPVTVAPGAVYGVTPAGVQDMLAYEVGEGSSTLAQRDIDGRLKAADPAAAQDVATKNYVDTHPGVTGGVPTTSQSNRVYVTTSGGAQSQIPYSNTEAEGNAMAQYTQDGELFVSTPTDPSRAANKAYVDSAIAAGGVQSPQIIQGPAATTVLHDAAPLTVVINASLGSQGVTLDFGISAGKRITLVRVDNGHPTFTVTIDPDGGSINGSQSAITLDAQWTVKNLIKVDSSDWVAF